MDKNYAVTCDILWLWCSLADYLLWILSINQHSSKFIGSCSGFAFLKFHGKDEQQKKVNGW